MVVSRTLWVEETASGDLYENFILMRGTARRRSDEKNIFTHSEYFDSETLVSLWGLFHEND